MIEHDESTWTAMTVTQFDRLWSIVADPIAIADITDRGHAVDRAIALAGDRDLPGLARVVSAAVAARIRTLVPTPAPRSYDIVAQAVTAELGRDDGSGPTAAQLATDLQKYAAGEITATDDLLAAALLASALGVDHAAVKSARRTLVGMPSSVDVTDSTVRALESSGWRRDVDFALVGVIGSAAATSETPVVLRRTDSVDGPAITVSARARHFQVELDTVTDGGTAARLATDLLRLTGRTTRYEN